MKKITYSIIVISALIICMKFPQVILWISSGLTTFMGWLLYSTQVQTSEQQKALEKHIHHAIKIHDELAKMESQMDVRIEQARKEAREEAIAKIDGDWK